MPPEQGGPQPTVGAVRVKRNQHGWSAHWRGRRTMPSPAVSSIRRVAVLGRPALGGAEWRRHREGAGTAGGVGPRALGAPADARG
jgi:hypothetical protein